ncbi:tetratricopeptide repeat protein [Zeaxanthinibacter enoshimensis]
MDTLGQEYFLLNDQENAIKSFEKALELKPSTNCHWCDNSYNHLKN